MVFVSNQPLSRPRGGRFAQASRTHAGCCCASSRQVNHGWFRGSDHGSVTSISHVRARAQRCRRQQSIKADAVLRAAKQRERSPKQEIEIGLSEAPVVGELSRWVSIARSLPRDRKDAVRRLLFMLVDRRLQLLREWEYLVMLIRVAEHYVFWRREPELWQPRSHNLDRQMSSLLRHLFADYPVPTFFDSAWLINTRIDRFARRWFIHVGRGENLCTASGLPFPMTKRMAHWATEVPAGHVGGPSALLGTGCGLRRQRSPRSRPCGFPTGPPRSLDRRRVLAVGHPVFLRQRDA